MIQLGGDVSSHVFAANPSEAVLNQNGSKQYRNYSVLASITASKPCESITNLPGSSNQVRKISQGPRPYNLEPTK